MKVYRIRHDSEGYQFFLPKRERDSLIFHELDGTAKGLSWSPPPLTLYSKKKLKSGDFFQFAESVLILNERARDALETYLAPAGEILPVDFQGAPYYVFNTTRCVDCLNLSATKWELDDPMFPGNIEVYNFKPSALKNIDLFKIPETAASEILLAESGKKGEAGFRAAVKHHGLQGLLFETIWDNG